MLLVSVGNTDKYIFCFFGTRCFWLQFECGNNSSNSTFPLCAHAQVFPFVWFHFGLVFTKHLISRIEILKRPQWNNTQGVIQKGRHRKNGYFQITLPPCHHSSIRFAPYPLCHQKILANFFWEFKSILKCLY